jgi:hypothetical protein
MNRIKFLICISIIFICFSVSAQMRCSYTQKAADNINKEIKLFIEECKKDRIANGKYAVYVANFYQMDFSKKIISLTMGSISNIYELPYICSDYIYYTGEEIVLIRINGNVDSSILSSFQYKKLDNSDTLKIKTKLIPPDEGEIVSDSKYLSLQIIRNKIIKLYKVDHEIPANQSIFINMPQYIMERKE